MRTMPVTLVMLEAIRDFFYETGIRIGMKPAGGIRIVLAARPSSSTEIPNPNSQIAAVVVDRAAV